MHFIGHKNIKTNIFTIQADNSIMCGYFSMRFTDFMLAGKSLIDYTSLFSPHNFKKNDNMILSYLKKTEYLKSLFKKIKSLFQYSIYYFLSELTS